MRYLFNFNLIWAAMLAFLVACERNEKSSEDISFSPSVGTSHEQSKSGNGHIANGLDGKDSPGASALTSTNQDAGGSQAGTDLSEGPLFESHGAELDDYTMTNSVVEEESP